MNGILLVVLIVAIGVLVALVAVVVPQRRRLVRADASHPGLGRLRRVTVVLRAAAVLVGTFLVVVTWDLGGLGRGLMLAPVFFGGTQVLGVLLADVVAHDTARSPGVAALELRRARDLVPSRLAGAVLGATVVLAGVLIWTTVTASPDDQARAGRVLSYRCVAECDSAAVGPWPGSYYSLPLAVGLLAVVLLTLFTLRQTARRPRNGADPDVLRVDGAIRRRAAESAVAGAGVAVTGSLAGIATVVGGRLLVAEWAPTAIRAAAWPAIVVGLAAVAALLWCVTVLLLPGTRPTPSTPPSARAMGGAAEPR